MVYAICYGVWSLESGVLASSGKLKECCFNRSEGAPHGTSIIYLSGSTHHSHDGPYDGPSWTISRSVRRSAQTRRHSSLRCEKGRFRFRFQGRPAHSTSSTGSVWKRAFLCRPPPPILHHITVQYSTVHYITVQYSTVHYIQQYHVGRIVLVLVLVLVLIVLVVSMVELLFQY